MAEGRWGWLTWSWRLLSILTIFLLLFVGQRGITKAIWRPCLSRLSRSDIICVFVWSAGNYNKKCNILVFQVVEQKVQELEKKRLELESSLVSLLREKLEKNERWGGYLRVVGMMLQWGWYEKDEDEEDKKDQDKNAEDEMMRGRMERVRGWQVEKKRW